MHPTVTALELVKDNKKKLIDYMNSSKLLNNTGIKGDAISH